MAVTEGTVRQVAALARLDLTEREVAELTAQLNGILEHMDALAAVDTAQAAIDEADPAAGPGGRAPLREDRPGADPLVTDPGDMAPDYADGFFTVPRLVSHADPGVPADGEGGAAS
jgi:aspartyl-tRNA(Asn)/glutamyl-tRNA(Gln) amidotransferase subunit C